MIKESHQTAILSRLARKGKSFSITEGRMRGVGNLKSETTLFQCQYVHH